MEIQIKEVKRSGKYSKDEKPEITLELSGRMTVYGDEVYRDFEHELMALINQYAI